MANEAYDSFVLNGREFTVICKPSATYLRADGRFWGDSLGEDLKPEDAFAMARVQAECMIIEERQQELHAIYQFYRPILSPAVREAMADYAKLTLDLDGKSFPVLYAPFNQNVYACVDDGWHFVDIAVDGAGAVAAARDFVGQFPAERRQPARPGQAVGAEQPAATASGLRRMVVSAVIALIVLAAVAVIATR
ncbi:MAG: hypothetical protein ACM31D_18210 [Bacteroidota bacterium]